MTADDHAQPEDGDTDRRATDRRQTERRKQDTPVAVERRQGKERRQGERRRLIDPATCEREYTADELEFMNAMDQYKRVQRCPFPNWHDVLCVLTALGYRRVAERAPLPGYEASLTPCATGRAS